MKSIFSGALSAICLINGIQLAEAFEREHEAHVHGSATLSLALEGEHLHIEFDSPSYNIFGFEHIPSDKHDKHIVDDAAKTLARPDKLFIINKSAECELEESEIESPQIAALNDSHEDHEDHENHDDHGHYEDDEHDHDHGHKHHDTHGHHGHSDHKKKKHEHHDHHDHGESGVHSDVRLSAEFHCHDPSELSTIDLKLFDVFTRLEQIEAQIISPKGQKRAVLKSAEHEIKL